MKSTQLGKEKKKEKTGKKMGKVICKVIVFIQNKKLGKLLMLMLITALAKSLKLPEVKPNPALHPNTKLVF